MMAYESRRGRVAFEGIYGMKLPEILMAMSGAAWRRFAGVLKL